MDEKMQTAVKSLINLGPLPSSKSASLSTIEGFEVLLKDVRTPVTDEEAKELVSLFGPDDCFGLSWALLHLVETSPNWPIMEALNGRDGEWIDRLRERAI